MFGAAGKMALAGAAAGITATAGAAVKGAVEFASFEDSMLNTNTMLNLSNDEFGKLQSGVLDLSKRFPKATGGADALAAGLYQAISAGVPASEALEFLEVAAKGATGGAVDTATAVGTMATALNAFKIPAEDSMKVSDLLFTTVANGVTTYDQLGASLFQAAPIFSSAGLSLEELLASTATLTKSGTPTAVAMTQMRSAVQSVLKPTPKLAAALEEAGYASGQAALDALGYHGALELVRDAADGDIGVMTEMLGSIESVQAVLGVTGENAATAAADLEAMGHASDGAGATMVAFDQKMSGLKSSWDRFMSVVSATAIAFGEQLAPVLKTVLNGLTDLLNGTSPLSPVFSGLATLFGGLFKDALAAIPVIVDEVSAVFSWLATNVIPGVTVAFEAVIGFLNSQMPTIRATVVPAFDAISAAISWLATNVLPVLMQWVGSVVNFVVENWPLISGALETGLNIVKFVVEGFIAAFVLALEAIQHIWPAIQVVIETVVGVIAGIIETFLAVLAGDWGAAWDGIKKVFESIWNGIVNFIGTIPDLIIGILKGFLAAAIVWTGAFAGKLLGWAGQFVGRFVGWFAQLPGRVMSAISSLIGKFLGWLGNLGRQAASSASRVVTGVVRFFVDMPGRVLRGIGSLPTKLMQFFREIPGKIWDSVTRIGKAIMDGLVDGVIGKVGQVIDDVVGAVGDVVGGVMNFLGIHSPSKVFEDIGRFSMEGLARGLGDPSMAQKALENSLSSLTSTGLTLNGESVGALRNGAAPIHIENVHLPNVEDAEGFVDALRHLGDAR